MSKDIPHEINATIEDVGAVEIGPQKPWVKVNGCGCALVLVALAWALQVAAPAIVQIVQAFR